MKPNRLSHTSLYVLVLFAILAGLAFSPLLSASASPENLQAEEVTPTVTLTLAPSPTTAPAATATTQPTELPPSSSYERPVLVIQTYSIDPDYVEPGKDLTLFVKLYNTGQKMAKNTKAIFTTGDLIPRETGGVVVLGEIAPDNRNDLTQPLTASLDVWGKRITSIQMSLTYQDETGASYSESFTITLPVHSPAYVVYTQTPTPTTTAAPVLRPQLIISNYKTDMEILQPGMAFNLDLGIKNAGNTTAKRVTMIVGGGSQSWDNNGTPTGPGGQTGDFSVFAPVGASNIQSLGDLEAGGASSAKQALIVNVTANPGAYSFHISFSYVDDKGRSFTDDQVITLLVYSLPLVDVDFYQQTAGFFVGQGSPLPLQIVNLGRKSAVLGNMRVTAEGADVQNNVVLVGNLDPGGYFPLDAMIIPSQPGPLTLTITIDYTDDFNQARKITKTKQIDVMEAQVIPETPSGPDGNGQIIEPPMTSSETFWQKVVRFFKGMLGLDSGVVETTAPIIGPVMPGGKDSQQQFAPVQVVPVKPLKGP